VKIYYYLPAVSKEQQASIVERRKAAEAAIEKRRQEAVAKQTEKKSIVEQTTQYLSVEAKHALKGPAPNDVIRQRISICATCPGRVDELDGVRDDGGVGFCTKCGCGANQRSKLSVKLTLAGVECPLGKFKKVEGTGGTIASAVEAAKGVAASAIDLVRKKFADDR
jgi:hypothetical protein